MMASPSGEVCREERNQVPLTLKSRFVGNVYVIRCVGSLVLGEEAKALGNLLEERTPEFSRYVLNLEGLTRLDSIGVGLLVRYADRFSRRGGGLRLAAPPEFVTRLLELTTLSEVLPQYATEEAAIVSFLRQGSAQSRQGRRGPRVLVFDPSADLCIFVRSVLGGHGFDVHSTCLFYDARVWLGVDKTEYILVGPGALGLAEGAVAKQLQKLSPGAQVLELAAEFESLDAGEATEELLRLFGAGQDT